jgi:hypothetical protein
MEMQLKEHEINSVYKGEIQKEAMEIKGRKELEVMGQKGDKDLKRMDILGKLAVEKAKQKGQKWKDQKSPWK